MFITSKEESPAGQERQSVKIKSKNKMVINLGLTGNVFPRYTIALNMSDDIGIATKY